MTFHEEIKRAATLFRSLTTNETQAIPIIAAALRQAADEMRQASIDACDDAIGACQGDREVEAVLECIKRIRALASPATAPAAEPCRAECASRMPDYSHYECTLPKGHVGPHKEGSFAEWTDATTVVAPSLLPRVLAALEGDWMDGYVRSCLAAELRRYIAEMEAGT